MLSFKPAFSLSSLTFLKRFFSSSLLSAIIVTSSMYLRLLIFLPAILILACVSSSLGFHTMYSAYELNKQGNHPQFTSKLRLREVNRATDSNFSGTVPVLQLKIPCHRSPSVPGKLERLVTCGVGSPPKELDPRDSSPDLMPGLRLSRCAQPLGK